MSNKITIDNFEFKLISKSVTTEDIDYYKVEISSTNLTTREEITFYAYISQSGTIWRLCSKSSRHNSSIEKYDNYIQATILDFRLQSFIFSNYDNLPLYGQPEITCEFERDKIIEFNYRVNGRGIEFEDTIPYIVNETTKKNIFDAYIKSLPVSIDTSAYTSTNFKDKYDKTEIEIYKTFVFDIIMDMLRGNEKKYEQYKKENNKYENVPRIFHRWHTESDIDIMVSFYFDKNWFNNDKRIELQHYLKNLYDVVDKNNKPIILGTDAMPRVPIMKYEMDFKFGKFNNEFFAIRLKNKHNDNILIVHIGKILLNLHTKPKYSESTFNGYHICNIIDENVKINKYGLYETYYTEPEYSDHSSGKTKANYSDKYITKPLEYSDQIDYNFCSGPFIYGSRYSFMCNCNDEKFLIKELIDEGKSEEEKARELIEKEKERELIEKEKAEELIEEEKVKHVMTTLQLPLYNNTVNQNHLSDAKNKYLKYKQKYINLKNKINRS